MATTMRRLVLAALAALALVVASPAGATVTTTTSSVTYTGSGGSDFTVTFPFLEASWLTVTKILIATGDETVLVNGSDYTVRVPSGSVAGSVHTTVAVTSSYEIEIRRNAVPYTQETSFRSQGVFRPVAYENALDKLTMLVLQLLGMETDDGQSAVDSHVGQADPHTQYALLAGRSGGQHLKGGTAASNNLTLSSTSNATKGKVVLGAAGTSAFDETNQRLGLGTAAPTKSIETTDGVVLDTGGTSSGFSIEDAEIKLRAGTGLLTLNGGTGSTASRLRLYGATHATLPAAARLGTDIFTIENESFLSTLATFDIDANTITLTDLVIDNSTTTLTLTMDGTAANPSTLMGGTAAAGSLLLRSTSNASKGYVYFGSSKTTSYDEVNERFGIGDGTPDAALDVVGSVLVSGDMSNDTSLAPFSIQDAIKYKTCTIAAGDTTPSVADCFVLTTSANAGPVAITDLDDPVAGQILWICGGSNTNSSTIADSGNFNLSASMTLSADDCIEFLVQADNDYIELTRVNN